MSAPGSAAEEPRIALVHDYFTQRGGAELVAARLARLFPEAAMFTSVVDPAALPAGLARGRLRTTSLQRWYAAGLPLRSLAPVLPAAFARLDLGDPAVVISSTSAFAHHVRPPARALHVAYCHAPPRFAWQPDEYFREAPLQRRLLAPALAAMRRLDERAARRVDVYVANSRATADRIARAYRRRAIVIPPPIETDRFTPSTERNGRFLVVSRLRHHKRIDLAIEAAARLSVRLDIIGEGPDEARLRRIAGHTVTFLGRLSDAAVADAMARCVGLVVPAAEDFGMTMAEVQAAGRPPIAFGDGGALEIVEDGTTGFLVREPTADAFVAAMLRACGTPLDPMLLVRSARRFDAARFDRAMLDLVRGADDARRDSADDAADDAAAGAATAARRAS